MYESRGGRRESGWTRKMVEVVRQGKTADDRCCACPAYADRPSWDGTHDNGPQGIRSSGGDK